MASLQLQLRQPTASGHCRCNNLGEVCVVYKYTNASLKQTATLYKFRGQIMFMGFGTPPTQWHGSFSEDSDGVVRLNFNCRGDVSRLHGATLFQTAPTRFFWLGLHASHHHDGVRVHKRLVRAMRILEDLGMGSARRNRGRFPTRLQCVAF